MTVELSPADAAARLAAVQARIAAAARACGRDPDTICLIAVGKTFGPERIAALAEAGQRDFGENYAAELQHKAEALAGLPDLRWHFIGPLQSNKTRIVARIADAVHSVDREKVARRLSAQRPPERGALDVLVQVNISGEASKSGVATSGAAALCALIEELPMLRLRGLMALPDPGRELAPQYRALAALREELARAGHPMEWLSAGMSDDLEVAIAHGATHVRVGRALFGERARPGA